MESSIVAKDLLHHFSHNHPLSLVHLQQPNHNFFFADYEDEDADEYEYEYEYEYEDEDEDEDEDDVNDFVEVVYYGDQCNMCKEQICYFHLCYYYCESCDYSLHKFCAELPRIQSNHQLHSRHILTLSKVSQCSNPQYYQSSNLEWKCFACNHMWMNNYNYHCSTCEISMDIVCATTLEQKIDHPSHPHRPERMIGPILSHCQACGNEHKWVFFQCTTCPRFRIYRDCAMLPKKLLIQNYTDRTFTYSHPLALSYSFPYFRIKVQFFPKCRVCDMGFYSHLWIYKCHKCRYYVHVDCATSKRDAFMSIIRSENLGDGHLNLLHCPFPDEGDNLLKYHMSNQKELFVCKQHDGEILNHSSHRHPLILFDKHASVGINMVSLHDPMKRIQLLCDGCVKPITAVPFYACCQYLDEQCCFVLHEWCAKLPSQVQDYAGHPEHTLFLLPKVPGKLFSVFKCDICRLPSNGFVYGCTICEYYVDINCAFIPEEITHGAHPNHLLSKVKGSSKLSNRYCEACHYSMNIGWGFRCTSCDFYIHVECALLLYRVVKHKCDKHPLRLRFYPAEKYIDEYFCEICEDELNPWKWFYHCTTCGQSMHAACAPIILQCEQTTYASDNACVYKFLNVKFGGMLKIKDHSHRLAFVQGLESDGKCSRCGTQLQYEMIFKCLECEFALDYECASSSFS